MLDIEKLKSAELPEITELIDEIYDAHNVISGILEKFKDSLKETKETIKTSQYTIKVSSYNQLVPKDINEILSKYPYDKFPDVYTIKLSKEAGSIIKEPELLVEKPIESVRFEKNG